MTNAETALIASIDLTHRPRPQSRREWRSWYATQRAARHYFDQLPGGQDLIEAYGLTADVIADQVRRWAGPPLPADLFTEWFGTPTPAVPAPTETPAEPAEPARGDGPVRPDLVDAVVTGQTDPVTLRRSELKAAAVRMYDDGVRAGTIQRRLAITGWEVRRLLADHIAAQRAGQDDEVPVP